MLHAISMLNTLRILFKCACTEPGLIPAIPTTNLDQSANYSVEYVREYERDFRTSKVEHFFSNNRFRLATNQGPRVETYPLSVCTTCN